MRVFQLLVVACFAAAIAVTAFVAGRGWRIREAASAFPEVSFRGRLELAPGLLLPKAAAFRLRLELRQDALGEVLSSETVEGSALSWPYEFRLRLPAEKAARAGFFQARLCYVQGNTNLCNMGVGLWEPIVRARSGWRTAPETNDRDLGTVYFNKHYARPEVAPCGAGRDLLAGRVSLSPGLRERVERWHGRLLLSAVPYVRIAEGMARVPKEELVGNKYFRYERLSWNGDRADFRMKRTTDRYGHYDLSLLVCDSTETDEACLVRGLVPAAGSAQGENQLFLVGKNFRAPFCGDEKLELYAAAPKEVLSADAPPELRFSGDLFDCPRCFRAR